MLEAGDHRFHDVFPNIGGQQFLQVDVGSVLRGHHHGVEPHRRVSGVLDGDLGLAVRPQVGNGPAAPDRGQPAGQPVRDHDRQRHQLGCLPAGVAEHHALISRALPVELVDALPLPVLVGVGDTLGDVGRLRPDGDGHAAGRAVVALDRRVVADVQDLLPDDPGNVHVCLGGDLAGDVNLAGSDHGLYGYPAARVVLDHGIQQCVTDLVGHLVGMTFSDGLGGEEATSHLTILICAESARG